PPHLRRGGAHFITYKEEHSMRQKNKGYELNIHSQDESKGIVEHSLDLQGLYTYDIINNHTHNLTKKIPTTSKTQC
ncbi:TPA: hypothetical protein ACOVJJ_004336, partial [Klebsiella oxytoca]